MANQPVTEQSYPVVSMELSKQNNLFRNFELLINLNNSPFVLVFN